MKYKRLAKDDLLELEKEFINFLSSAQITAKDWEQMKKSESEKAEELLDVFSDMVYEKVLSKISYLEYRTKNILNVYQCLADKIILVGLRVKEGYDLDLTSTRIFKEWKPSDANAVSVIRSEKQIVDDRGLAVFELLQSGCLITDDKLFNLINNIILKK